VKKEFARVAYFPCVYHEIDGVGQTARQFEAFAKRHEIPFFMVLSGPRDEIRIDGSVTRVQLKRGPVKFPLDRAHDYDLLFLRHYRKVEALLREFRPEVVQITGPSDVGTLGAMCAHRMRIPLAASWQTNLHEYSRRRAAAALSFLPGTLKGKIADAAEGWSFRATARFYKIPRLLFAPNQELVPMLEAATSKPCYLMSHAVNTEVFRPELRDRVGGPFTIGYVGRLTAEKNVRMLARLEQALAGMGHRDFRFVIVGEGAESEWLRKNMQRAELTGVLTGAELARTFANFDLLAFPSETDTFGLVVLEAFASGVPAVVTDRGGPQFSVAHGQTGFVARSFDEFAAYTSQVMSRADVLASMRLAAREKALTTSWERIFEGMYDAYERCLLRPAVTAESIFHVATT
jgi:phosphatidylinositol alpha 1,6-mannosyltransferase